MSDFITRVGYFENFNSVTRASALAESRALLAGALGALSDSREFEQSDLTAGLTVRVVTHVAAQPHLALSVPVETVEVQGGPDHGGLVQVQAGRRVGRDLAVVQLKVTTAQSVVALTFPHMLLLGHFSRLHVLLLLVLAAHHVPLELSEGGRSSHLDRVAILTRGAPVRGSGGHLALLGLELRSDDSWETEGQLRDSSPRDRQLTSGIYK